MSFREDAIEKELAQMNFGDACLNQWETMFAQTTVDNNMTPSDENMQPIHSNTRDPPQQHASSYYPDEQSDHDATDTVNESNYLRYGNYLNSFLSTHMIPRPYEGEIDWNFTTLTPRIRVIQTLLHLVQLDRDHHSKIESHKETQADLRRDQQDLRNKVKQYTTEVKQLRKDNKALSNKLKMREQSFSEEQKKLKTALKTRKRELDDSRAMIRQQNKKLTRADIEISRAQTRVEEFMQRSGKRVKAGTMRYSHQNGRTEQMAHNPRNQLESEKQLLQEQVDSLHQQLQAMSEENAQLMKGFTENEVQLKDAIARMNDILGGAPVDTAINHHKYALPYGMGKTLIRDGVRKDMAVLNARLEAYQTSFSADMVDELNKLRQENESLKTHIHEQERVQMMYMGKNRTRDSPHDRRRMSAQRDEYEEQVRVLDAKQKVLDEKAERLKREKKQVLEMRTTNVYPASSELSDPFLDELDDDLLRPNHLMPLSSNPRSNSGGSISASVSTGSSRANRLRVDTNATEDLDFDLDDLDRDFSEFGLPDVEKPTRNVTYGQSDEVFKMELDDFEYDF